jgi:ketosteroid isomerase-like protein
MNQARTMIVVAFIAISGVLLPGPPRASAAQASESAGTGAGQSAMEREIVAKEREGLDALKAGQADRFGDLTADEAIFVDAHGEAGKAQVLKNVAGFTLTEYTMDDVKFIKLSADTGLISYLIQEKGISHGRDFTAQAYVSSIWTERDHKWLCLFSQETAAK